MSDEAGGRYAFGANWEAFVRTSFTPLRREAARRNLLSFMDRPDLDGLTFLDIGSGSGLHSLAAFDAGAARIHSFDYDAQSVSTPRDLRRIAGRPNTLVLALGDEYAATAAAYGALAVPMYRHRIAAADAHADVAGNRELADAIAPLVERWLTGRDCAA